MKRIWTASPASTKHEFDDRIGSSGGGHGADYDSGADKAAAALDQFELATRALEVEHDARSTFDVSFAATRTLTGMSRLYDLNVVAQPDRAHPSATDFLAETILFGSGRPLLLVPYIARGAFSCDRILICWDGGLPAARAVHDALPFLEKAQTIDIVTVNEPENGDGQAAASALQADLARRDPAVRPFPRPPAAPIFTTPSCRSPPTTPAT